MQPQRPLALRSRRPRNDSGNGTRRSLSPLPLRTQISFRAKSTSLIRRRRPSSKRMPVPYNRRAISSGIPSGITDSMRATSSCDSTTGRRRGRFALTTSSIHGNSISSTTR